MSKARTRKVRAFLYSFAAFCIQVLNVVLQNAQGFLVVLFLVHRAVFRYNKGIET